MTTFNPAAEHRCSRCGQWWWSTHTCPDQLGRVVPPPRFAQGAPIEVTTTDKIAAERDALRDEVERLRTACSRENDTISQVLGRALGYPRFADDQKNFPGATDADGVCVGDHVAASLADEAANVIRELRSEVERLRADLPAAYQRGYTEALNDCIRNGGEQWARSMFADGGDAIDAARAAQGDKT